MQARLPGVDLRLSALLVALTSAGPALAEPGTQAPGELTVLQVDPATFAVVRTRAGGGAVEGFMVDRDALLETLRTRVLEEQGLGALARVAAVADPARTRDGAGAAAGSLDPARYLDFRSLYTFAHRFAPPFSQLRARLDLAPLSGTPVAGELLYPLAVGLALAVVLGLFALYRMVAVQVLFAQRRSNFVSAVSHELKTPLTAIRMYGEMLRDDLVESEAKRREYYATISAETERLSRLINNVLELSRLERRERHVDMRVGDVSEVAREAIELFRPHAQAEGFALSFEAEADLPTARFDRDALKQVLFNLLDNALKYGRDAQHREIQVTCHRLDEHICLSVRDFGPGVQAGQLRTVFEPFYRAQDELTRKQKGSGIGLSLVKGLVDRMQGEVEGRNASPGFEVRVALVRA